MSMKYEKYHPVIENYKNTYYAISVNKHIFSWNKQQRLDSVNLYTHT